MQFIWGGNREEINSQNIYTLQTDGKGETLTVCAADFYQIFLDGKFTCFGPKRTAAGFTRPDTLSVCGVKEIVIVVTAYNIPCYSCDRQLPFFGAEVKAGDKILFTAKDFACSKSLARRQDMPRYSRQRAFIEGYDFTNTDSVPLQTQEVPAPTVIRAVKERSQYKTLPMQAVDGGDFTGFAQVDTPWWERNPNYKPKEGDFHVVNDFVEQTKTGYAYQDFNLESERTGFIRLQLQAKEETELFVVFEEYLPEGKWIFRRTKCNDLIVLKIPAGKTEFLSFEPYTFQHLRLLYKGELAVVPTLVTLENDEADCVRFEGAPALQEIFRAAQNTFRQNAVDLFTDCPGRERAGWLCDSYFTAKAELLFAGNNDVERAFLENYLIATTPELDPRIVPMCFPSEHDKGHLILNWAMWFCLEICDYYKRSGDFTLPEQAKKKVYGIIEYLDEFIGESGLLENLNSWVFVEWSICNDPEYVKGLNFPSNMLYAYALEEVGKLYGDDGLCARADEMRKRIVALGYNGEFFIDNAVRVDGVLTPCATHLTETCQYYALFTGICPDEAFRKRMLEEFGTFRKEDCYPEVARSKIFIGNYLRFFWLCEEEEYDRVLRESVDYFHHMVEKTGTIWEHDLPSASCNHGFASVFAVLMLRCTVGYAGTKDGKPVFAEGKRASEYTAKVEFDYEGVGL